MNTNDNWSLQLFTASTLGELADDLCGYNYWIRSRPFGLYMSDTCNPANVYKRNTRTSFNQYVLVWTARMMMHPSSVWQGRHWICTKLYVNDQGKEVIFLKTNKIITQMSNIIQHNEETSNLTTPTNTWARRMQRTPSPSSLSSVRATKKRPRQLLSGSESESGGCQFKASQATPF